MEWPDLCLDLEYAILGQRMDKVNVAFDNLKATGNVSELSDGVKELALCLCDGEYVRVLEHPVAAHFLGAHDSSNSIDAPQELDIYITKRISQYLHSTVDTETQSLRQLVILFVGVASLQLFVQQNWTGPLQGGGSVEFLPACFRAQDQEGHLQEISINKLNSQGQCIYSLVEDAVYLLMANALLVEELNKLTLLKSSCLWALRCLAVRQKLMDEHSDDVMTKTFDLIDRVCDSTPLQLQENDRYISCQVQLELGHLSLYYYKMSKAKEYFNSAMESLGITFSLTGALGKRTKFQEKFVSQLKLDVKKEENRDRIPAFHSLDTGDLPKNVAMNDDTLLDSVKFKDSQNSSDTVSLHPLEEAVVLAFCILSQKSQAVHHLTSEELLAYVESVVRQPKSWCVQSLALLMRSKLETGRRRKAERSMMQLEVLVNAVKESNPRANIRQLLFYCLPLPPRWKVQRELAQALVSMGAVKSALEIFQRLQMWEDVITCYQSLGWHAKAENLVREKLKEKETVTMCCLLGDITKDAAHYERAWEISNHRSSRAQRSLGLLHLRAVRYTDCIPCFQKSLQINSLQEDIWFSLGCAAMATGDLELASKSFHRCVTIDQDNAEAWNNLANIYLKQKKKQKAHRALQEALRSNYENWHMWENYLVVSIDVGAFNDAIRSFHRLMDLREKYKDVEILGLLVKAVNEGMLDNNGVPASRLRKELLKLMGRITSQITNDAETWRLYSDLYMTSDSTEDKEKALNFLVKAHRVSTQAPDWECDVSKFQEMIQMTLNLAEVYLQVSEAKTDNAQAIQLLSSAKLIIKQLVSKAKKHHPDSGGVIPDLIDCVDELEAKLQSIVEKITALKS